MENNHLMAATTLLDTVGIKIENIHQICLLMTIANHFETTINLITQAQDITMDSNVRYFIRF